MRNKIPLYISFIFGLIGLVLYSIYQVSSPRNQLYSRENVPSTTEVKGWSKSISLEELTKNAISDYGITKAEQIYWCKISSSKFNKIAKKISGELTIDSNEDGYLLMIKGSLREQSMFKSKSSSGGLLDFRIYRDSGFDESRTLILTTTEKFMRVYNLFNRSVKLMKYQEVKSYTLKDLE